MNNKKNKITNKVAIVIFTTLLANINNIFATSLTIKCIEDKWELKCHDHKMVACDQEGSTAEPGTDDYNGDYYKRYAGAESGHRCYLRGGEKDGYGYNGTSDFCDWKCLEYALFIGNKQIGTVEQFLEQVPVTELIKLYDPNMVP